MNKKLCGMIIFLFGISVLGLELFFIPLMQHFSVEAGADLSMPYLLFAFFPMNLGFYIPIVLIIIGIIVTYKNIQN